MSIKNHFYNGTTRRYVALFGSLFNKMIIERDDNDGNLIQEMVVPIAYGPFQKFLARITQDPNLDRAQAISLPRMSFEITSMSYDATRRTNSLNKIRSTTSDTSFVYSPAPYNLEFSLYIMTKHSEDGTKILEQILPDFKPEYTFSARIMDDLDPIDLPLVLTSVSSEDIYEGDFETRRSLLWTLSFTLKGWFFGPQKERAIIKFVDVRTHNNTLTDTPATGQITVQPGLTAEGTPTDDINNTVDYNEIEINDDWGVIAMIEEYQDEPD